MGRKKKQLYWYTTPDIKPVPEYNGGKYCPKCGGLIYHDIGDLACWICGWRIVIEPGLEVLTNG